MFVRAPGGVYPRGRVCPVFTGRMARGALRAGLSLEYTESCECACGDRARDASEAPGAEKAPKYWGSPLCDPSLETPPGREAWTRPRVCPGLQAPARSLRGDKARSAQDSGRGGESQAEQGSSGIHSRAVLRSDRCRPGPEPRSESPVLPGSAPAVSWAPGDVVRTRSPK